MVSTRVALTGGTGVSVDSGSGVSAGATSIASPEVVSLSGGKGAALFACAGCVGKGVFVGAGAGGSVAAGNAGVKGGRVGVAGARKGFGVTVGVNVGRRVAFGKPLFWAIKTGRPEGVEKVSSISSHSSVKTMTLKIAKYEIKVIHCQRLNFGISIKGSEQ